jgi:hypothetical protein
MAALERQADPQMTAWSFVCLHGVLLWDETERLMIEAEDNLAVLKATLVLCTRCQN